MKPSVKRIIQKFFLIPQRYVLAIMGFLAITNAYQLRVCLNVAITEMVIPISNDVNSTHYDPDACPDDNDDSSGSSNSSSTKPDGTELFDWDEETQGLILSSFFWGYVLTHMPGGILADKFGGKYTLGIGILGTSVFTMLIPVAAKAGHGWLLAVRVITGLGEGTTFPAINDLLSRWIPLQERGFLGSLVFAGSQIGTITGTLLSGYLLDTYKGEWPLVFYVFGGIGMIWCFLWAILCYSEPETHPYITDKEKLFLSGTMGDRKQDVPAPPWRHIFLSFPVWALVCAQIGHDWGFYTMVTDLPKYMKDVLKYSIGQNGVLSSIPYIVMWLVSLGSGWIADQVIKRKWLSVTATRKFFTSIAHIGPSAALISASYAGCDRTTVVVLFTLTMGLMGTFYPGMKVNALDLSPNYAGTLMAIVNGIGGITGIITPYLVGVLTPNHTLLQWRTVFWITVGVNLVTIVIFVWGGSGEVQPWNNIKHIDCEKEDIKKEKKSSVISDKMVITNNIIDNEKL